MTEKEFDGDWFDLKQNLAKWVLKDIEEEWRAENMPSTTRLIYETSNLLENMVVETISYLKELGHIHILYNKMNNSDVILEEDMFDELGINADQDKKK